MTTPEARSYVWGYMVAGCLLIEASFCLFLLTRVEEREAIIFYGLLALFLGATAVGLKAKQKWGLGLFYIYAILVSLFILLVLTTVFAVMLITPTNPPPWYSPLVWFSASFVIVVFGPASIPYFNRRRKDFEKSPVVKAGSDI